MPDEVNEPEEEGGNGQRALDGTTDESEESSSSGDEGKEGRKTTGRGESAKQAGTCFACG